MSRHAPFHEVEASRPDFSSSTSFTYTKTPDPKWKPGQGTGNVDLPGKEAFRDGGKKKTFIPGENISVPDTYKLLINSVVPRPVCFCSTLTESGTTNIAPFSYFAAVSHNPPLIMVSFQVTDGKPKDSGANIMKTRQFVANIVSEPLIEAMNYTAINTPPDVSEWSLSGLTQEPSVKVKPARVKEAGISMECELFKDVEIFNDDGKQTQIVVFGRVVAWHVREDLLVDGGPVIDIAKLLPISRLGGISFGRTITGYELPRPRWEEEKEKPEIQALLSKDEKKAKA